MSIESITQGAVRDMLLHLSRGRTPEATPLSSLAAVEHALRSAGLPPGERSKRYEIGRLLSEIAQNELDRLRHVTGLPSAPPSDPARVRAQIRADFSVDHAALEAISAVYHLYVRSDLGIGLDELVALLADRHRRTVQRRLQRGVEALAAALRAAERRAASISHRARITQGLPSGIETEPVGRSRVIARVCEAVLDGGPPVAIAGCGGAGKTTLARAVVVRLLDLGAIDAVEWISASQRGEAANTRRADRFAQGSPAVTARRVAERAAEFRRGMLVVDDLNSPSLAAFEAEAALSERAAGCLLVGRGGWSGVSGVRVVEVPPLAAQDARLLLRRAAECRGLATVAAAPDRALTQIIGAAGGHPGVLCFAASALRSTGAAGVARIVETGEGSMADELELWWGAAWRRAGRCARAMVRAACSEHDAGCSSEPGPLAIAAGLAPGSPGAERALRSALDEGLLLPVGDAEKPRFRPPFLLERYVRSREADAVHQPSSSRSSQPVSVPLAGSAIAR